MLFEEGMINLNSILSVENLSLTIDKEKLLKNISFNIKQGEIFALVGESGSGKSLTSLAIMRLLPDVISVSVLLKVDADTNCISLRDLSVLPL